MTKGSRTGASLITGKKATTLRVLTAVDKLLTELTRIADERAHRQESIRDRRTTRREQIDQEFGSRPIQADFDGDDILAKIKSESQDQRRECAIKSLWAVYGFISDGLGRVDLLRTDGGLSDLNMALMNAAEGRKGDMNWLTRRPTDYGTGAPRESLESEMLRGAIAAVMQTLINGGLSRKDAAKFILKKFPRNILDPLLPSTTTAATERETVVEWRDGVIGPNVREPRIGRREGFDLYGRFPFEDDGGGPEQRALSMIDAIVGATQTSD